ncbi:MAG: ABC transporter ATP-binding protein [Gammaproteobacteria bacterium]|jgi:zinc transport system ATP-binding protein
MSAEPVVRLADVSFSYGGPLALEHVSLEIAEREFLGLVGPNGGGKSTLLKIVLGLLEPDAGRVTVFGRPPAQARGQIGYVPQYTAFARDFPMSVEEVVLLGRLGRTRLWGGYRRQDRALARRAMEETNIADLARRRLNTLSGGQFQRMLIARALTSEPRLLILDEPTANIDLRAEQNIFDLFRRLNERMTVLVVSHDIGFITQYVSRVACLNRTLVCHPTAALSGDIIKDLYGTPVRMIEHTH